MIEARVVPVFGRVTTRAVVAAAPVMGIVFCMTIDTCRRRARECPIFVTTEARNILMLAN